MINDDIVLKCQLAGLVYLESVQKMLYYKDVYLNYLIDTHIFFIGFFQMLKSNSTFSIL